MHNPRPRWPTSSISAATTIAWSALVLGTHMLVQPVAVDAQMYRWKNSDGQTQYGDRPPVGVEAVPLKVQRHRPDPTARSRLKSLVERSRQTPGSTDTSESRQDSDNESGTDDALCSQKRKELDMLGEQLPVYRDADGKMRVHQDIDTYKGARSYISDAERPGELAAARKGINEFCQRPDDAAEQQAAREAQVRAELCSAFKADLELVKSPHVRASRDKLAEAHDKVAEYCD